MDTKICLWLSCLITLPAILLTFLFFIMKKIINTSFAPSVAPLDPSLAPLNTCSLSTSPPAGWDYEVFLSFRGKDTRKTFTDYLYHDLTDAGIRTFRDDNELRIGEEICSELVNAIEHSKISIPVFSKDYASSKWCLVELTHMVESKKTSGQIIKPIFYDVEPSDVRKQMGSYEKAFREHEKKFDSATVKGWKKALRKVGRLKGWEVKNVADGHQGALVKRVVLEVWGVLKRNSSIVNERLVGIDYHVEEMMKLLSVNSSDARIVGIHGIGGIGKTTIAKVIYHQLSQYFRSCCFLEDVRQKAQPPNGLVHLQNQLLSNVLNLGCSNLISTKDEGINEIKKRFSGKKVLVVVDDADHRSHLDALVGDCAWFGSGSRIIVTTRNKEILNLTDINWTYEPKELNSNQSLRLFSRHAFRRDDPPEDYDTLSRDVVSTTGGLPLAVEIIGSALSGKGKEVWEGTLKKLKKIPNDEVQKKLKISYDALNKEQQQIFLDIACLFIGVDKRIAFYMWDDCNFYPKIEIDALLLRSLVKIGNKNELRMHDQLRDFGKEIVRQESIHEPGERSRVWIPQEAFKILETYKGTKKIEALCVDFRSQNSQARCRTNEEFVNLSNLRFLQMDSAILDGNFKRLLSELRWLRWNGCPQIFRPTNFHLENLVILDLSRSKITEAWEGWNHIKIVRNLKVLDLTGCSCMITTPDFSAYTTLERLILEDCESLTHIDPSIGYLKSLVFINVKNCAKLSSTIDPLIGPLEFDYLEALKELLIDGTSIQEVPIGRGVMKKLETLSATRCESLERLPNLSNLEMLEELKLDMCEKLHDIEGLKGLKSFKILDLSYCIALERLPDLSTSKMLEEIKLYKCQKLHDIEGLKGLKSLKMLDLSYCIALERLPDLSTSKMLEKIELYHCEKLHDIEGLKGLKSLKTLGLAYCEALERIPNLSKSEMLEELYFYECEKLHEIEGLKAMKSLKELSFLGCKVLERLPDLSNLEMLKKLEFNKCWELHEIEGLKAMKSLKRLDLSFCRALERLPNLSNSKMLEDLNFHRCYKLHDIEGLRGLKSLKKLDLSFCEALERLPDLSNSKMMEDLNFNRCCKLHDIEGLNALKLLKTLKLSHCDALERVPNLSYSKMLEKLNLYFCPKLHDIEGLKALKSLNTLDLSYCTTLERVPDLLSLEMLKALRLYQCSKLHDIGGLKALKSLMTLDLSGCKALERLPDLSKMEMLKELILDECWKLHDIGGLEALKSLKVLCLPDCSALERLPDLSKLEMLKDLRLDRCTKLHDIEGLKALKSLKMLSLFCCRALERLPNLSNLEMLEYLDLDECRMLHDIEGLKALKSLKTLKLSSCIALERLPDLSNLEMLEYLYLDECQKLHDIEGLKALKSLKMLKLSSCIALERLPDLSKLEMLKDLRLYRCEKLHDIEGLKALKSLKILNLFRCRALERLPDLSNSEMLEYLNLDECQKLHDIEGLKALKSLKTLKLSCCIALKRLPEMSRLTNLKELILGMCVNLTEIWGLEELKFLEFLDIFGCESLGELPDILNIRRVS